MAAVPAASGTWPVVDGGNQCLDAGYDDIGIGSGAPGCFSIGPGQADIAGCPAAGVGVQGVFGIGIQGVFQTQSLFQGVVHGVDAAVALTEELVFLSVHSHGHCCPHLLALHVVRIVEFHHRSLLVEIGFIKNPVHFIGFQLGMGMIGDRFYGVSEVLPHLRGHVVAIGGFQNVADAAFAGLGVDPDHIRVIGAGYIMGINGQIRHGPLIGAVFFPVVHAFGNGILMAAGERREDQTAGIGLPGRYLHVGDPFVHLADLRHVREIQFRVHTVGVHVHGKCHRIHVARPLAVAEQTAFHSLCPGQERQLRIGNACAPVVVGMGGEDDGIATVEPVAAVLNLVGVDVRQAHFDGDGKVDDHGAVRGGFHDVNDGVADFQGVFGFGSGEGFRGVLEEEIAVVFFGELPDEAGAVDGDLLYFFFGFPEYLFALGDGGGVVEVDDGAGGTLDGFEGTADDVVTALGEDLEGDVVGDEVLFDEGAEEFVFGFTGCREADFDFLESDFDQELEEFDFFFEAHGDDQGLVAVAEVHGAPGGCVFDVVFFDPAVFVFGCGIIAGGVFGCVHHGDFLLFCVFPVRGIKNVSEKFFRDEQDITRGTTLFVGVTTFARSAFSESLSL